MVKHSKLCRALRWTAILLCIPVLALTFVPGAMRVAEALTIIQIAALLLHLFLFVYETVAVLKEKSRG